MIEFEKRMIIQGLEARIEEEQAIIAASSNRAEKQISKGKIEIFRVGTAMYSNEPLESVGDWWVRASSAEKSHPSPSWWFREYLLWVRREERGRSAIGVGRRAACQEILGLD